MTVQIKLTVNASVFENMSKELGTMPSRAQAIGKGVYDGVLSAFLKDLKQYPPKPAGSRYKRTYRLKRNWKVTFEPTQSGFQIIVSNKTRYTRFVMGDLVLDRVVASAPQRYFHARNGWKLGIDKTLYWFNVIESQFLDAFIADLQGIADVSFARRELR